MIFKNNRSYDWTCLFKLRELNFHKKIVYDDLDVFIKDTINWPALFSVSISNCYLQLNFNIFNTDISNTMDISEWFVSTNHLFL